jgi:hypothetical protein
MKTIYKVILVNFASLVGFVIVLFTIPEGPSLTLLGLICLAMLILVNTAVFVWPRYRRRGGVDRPSSKSTVGLIVIWIIFLLGLAWNLRFWHHR